jgi:hypothetical protein
MATTWNDGTMESVSQGHHFPIWIKVDTADHMAYKAFFQDLKRSAPLKTQKIYSIFKMAQGDQRTNTDSG